MQKTLLAIALALLFSFTQTTPAAAATYAPSSITEDTTWTKANGPYLVDMLSIPAGVTLTIEPGTIVKLGQPSCLCYVNITVYGHLVVGAENTVDRAVITSIYDDIGGDTNGDGTTTPSPSDWASIDIQPGGVLELYNSDVRYGGVPSPLHSPYDYQNSYIGRQIDNRGGTVIMDHADLGFGLYANYNQWGSEGVGTTTIRNSTIHDATIGIAFSGAKWG